jgi:hypothetical protein
MMEPPYLLTSDLEDAAVDQEQIEPGTLPTKMVRGYHTLWIAEVPFIPAINSDSKDFGYVAQQRLELILKRQKRFLSDLSRYQGYQTTFELRFVARPQAHDIAHIGLAVLGKVFHTDRLTSRKLALKIWQYFEALFPLEPPFSYPLIPVQFEPRERGLQQYSFMQWYQPVPFDQLTGSSLVELRKYEDWPIPSLTGLQYMYDYLPHSFEPALDYSALSRLLATLVEQQNSAVVSITIRPQRLNSLEIPMLYILLGWNRQLLMGSRIYGNQTIPSPFQMFVQQHGLPFDISALHFKQRAALGCEVYENLLQQWQTLFLTRLQVIGIPQAEQTLVEALGSEIVANANHPISKLWSTVSPRNAEEIHWARFNTQWLEFSHWGMTHNILPLTRLRQFATVDEVFAAFRLPIASGHGLPGLVVRDEPFALPAAYVPAYPDGLLVGTLQDRGMPTTVPCYLPKEGLLCLFGESKEAQSLILQGMLEEVRPLLGIFLNAQCSLPLLEDKREIQHLTLNLALRSSFPVSPLLIPAGSSPASLFHLWIPLLATLLHFDAFSTALLHLASVQVSEQYTSDWTLATFVQHLYDFLQQNNLPALDNIRYILVPLAELLAPWLSLALDRISSSLSSETSLLIHLIGATGTISESLLAGLLWSWCALAFSLCHNQSQQTPRGFIALDSAHVVLGHTSNIFSRQILELLRHGGTSLLIDDRSDLLNEQLMSNASSILVTACQNTQLYGHIASQLALSHTEVLRMQRLRNNEAILSIPRQKVVLVDLL